MYVLRKLFAVLVPTAFSLGPAKTALPEANGPPSIAAFMQRLGEDAAMRERFARDPNTVLSQAGIDPRPFALEGQLSGTDVDRLIGRWRMAEKAGRPGTPVPPAKPEPTPQSEQGGEDETTAKKVPPKSKWPAPAEAPVAVYGPPPGMRSR